MFRDFRKFKDEDSEEFCLPFGMQYQQTKIPLKRNVKFPNIEYKQMAYPLKKQNLQYKHRNKQKLKTLPQNFQQSNF